MQVNRHSARIAWAVALTVSVTAAVPVTVAMLGGASGSEVPYAAAWALVPAVFAASAAIILSRQPRNVIGWLLLVPAVSTAADNVIVLWLASFTSAPRNLAPGLFAALAFNNYSWLLLIFPLFHLLQVFPTGSPLSDGWRWFLRIEYAMAAFLMVAGLLAAEIGPFDERWSITNPIGVVPTSLFESIGFGAIWTIGLLVLAIGGAGSVVTRYRRSKGEERLQLKWLLYAFSQFVVVYSVLAIVQGWIEQNSFDLLFVPLDPRHTRRHRNGRHPPWAFRHRPRHLTDSVVCTALGHLGGGLYGRNRSSHPRPAQPIGSRRGDVDARRGRALHTAPPLDPTKSGSTFQSKSIPGRHRTHRPE